MLGDKHLGFPRALIEEVRLSLSVTGNVTPIMYALILLLYISVPMHMIGVIVCGFVALILNVVLTANRLLESNQHEYSIVSCLATPASSEIGALCTCVHGYVIHMHIYMYSHIGSIYWNIIME